MSRKSGSTPSSSNKQQRPAAAVKPLRPQRGMLIVCAIAFAAWVGYLLVVYFADRP
jgi:hypothetical protein